MSTFNVLPGLGYSVQRDEDTGRACDECLTEYSIART